MEKRVIKETEVTKEIQHTQDLTFPWWFWIFFSSSILMVPRTEIDYRTTLTILDGTPEAEEAD